MDQALNQINKEEYAKAVCLFLSEQLRTHKISLQRAADIASKIVSNLNLIDTEHDFLQLIKELSKEFEILIRLEEKVFFYAQINERKRMEQLVREFVIGYFASDSKMVLELLLEAIRSETTIAVLEQKFPVFSRFVKQQI